MSLAARPRPPTNHPATPQPANHRQPRRLLLTIPQRSSLPPLFFPSSSSLLFPSSIPLFSFFSTSFFFPLLLPSSLLSPRPHPPLLVCFLTSPHLRWGGEVKKQTRPPAQWGRAPPREPVSVTQSAPGSVVSTGAPSGSSRRAGRSASSASVRGTRDAARALRGGSLGGNATAPPLFAGAAASAHQGCT